MLSRLIAIIRKETLVLIRDKAGLAVLYLMPLVLIFVMVFIQDRTFHFLQDVNVPVLFLNEDKELVGNSVEESLNKINQIHLFKEIDETNISIQKMKQLVAAGDYKAGIYVPLNLTKNISQKFENVQPQNSLDSQSRIIVYFDPAIQQNFRSLIESVLREILARTEIKILYSRIKEQMDMFGVQLNTLIAVPDSQTVKNGLVHLEAISLNRAKSQVLPNSVQHNVPGWSLFAMFFIAIPLASSMIQERDEGSLRRLLSMPVNYIELLLGKLIVYLAVCLSQLFLIVAAGKFIMPVLGFPVLQIGNQPAIMLLVAVSSALAAIGYGILIGAVAGSQNQASSFGAISVIIAAAIGGIWVPVFIMPDFMQYLSDLSPLACGLNAFHEVFLRNGAINAVFMDVFKLNLFFLFTICIVLFKFKLRRQ